MGYEAGCLPSHMGGRGDEGRGGAVGFLQASRRMTEDGGCEVRWATCTPAQSKHG